MRSRSLLPVALLVAVLAAGCGSENPELIPRQDADDLTARVDEAAQAVADGQCDQAREAVAAARREVAELPRRVDSRLEDNLVDWLRHLDRQIREECEEKAAEPTPTATPAAAETATPEATETATPEPTETATPEPTETATPETTVDPGTGGEGSPEEEPGAGIGVPEGDS